MRGDYVDDHSEADSGAYDPIPLNVEIVIFSLKQWNCWRQLNLRDPSVDQKNDDTCVDYLKHEHLHN